MTTTQTDEPQAPEENTEATEAAANAQQQQMELARETIEKLKEQSPLIASLINDAIIAGEENSLSNPLQVVMNFFNAGYIDGVFDSLSGALDSANIIGESGPGGVFKPFQQDQMAGINGPSQQPNVQPTANSPDRQVPSK